MYGMYGAIDKVGSKGNNPFISRPGAAGADNNPFAANNNAQNKTSFNPFEGGNGTVGLGPETQDKQKLTIGIA
ncbi:MAG: hypothetical protein AB1782_14480 [Cyanobacteriota bacterium]